MQMRWMSSESIHVSVLTINLKKSFLRPDEPVRTKLTVFRRLMAPSEQIWVFLRPDGQSEQILTFLANAYYNPNILGENFEILSVHLRQVFGNFHLALPPIFRGPQRYRI